MTAPVAIIMGSQSDWPTMSRAAEALDKHLFGSLPDPLDLPGATQDDTPLGPGIHLPEWNFRTASLQTDHVCLQALEATSAPPARRHGPERRPGADVERG